MRVRITDGQCRECGGELEVVGADDVSMNVLCILCGETYPVETDAFHDGGLEYWPVALFQFGHET